MLNLYLTDNKYITRFGHPVSKRTPENAYISNEAHFSPHFTPFHHFSPHILLFHQFSPLSALSPHSSPLSPYFTIFHPIHPFHPISPLFTPCRERGEWGEMGWMGWKGWMGGKGWMGWKGWKGEMGWKCALLAKTQKTVLGIMFFHYYNAIKPVTWCLVISSWNLAWFFWRILVFHRCFIFHNTLTVCFLTFLLCYMNVYHSVRFQQQIIQVHNYCNCFHWKAASHSQSAFLFREFQGFHEQVRLCMIIFPQYRGTSAETSLKITQFHSILVESRVT